MGGTGFAISTTPSGKGKASGRVTKTPVTPKSKNKLGGSGSTGKATKKTPNGRVKEEMIDDSVLDIKKEAGAGAAERGTSSNSRSPSEVYPTPKEASNAMGFDGSGEPKTPTPSRTMASRGKRVKTYATDSEDESDKGASDFHDAVSNGGWNEQDDLSGVEAI